MSSDSVSSLLFSVSRIINIANGAQLKNCWGRLYILNALVLIRRVYTNIYNIARISRAQRKDSIKRDYCLARQIIQRRRLSRLKRSQLQRNQLAIHYQSKNHIIPVLCRWFWHSNHLNALITLFYSLTINLLVFALCFVYLLNALIALDFKLNILYLNFILNVYIMHI